MLGQTILLLTLCVWCYTLRCSIMDFSPLLPISGVCCKLMEEVEHNSWNTSFIFLPVMWIQLLVGLKCLHVAFQRSACAAEVCFRGSSLRVQTCVALWTNSGSISSMVTSTRCRWSSFGRRWNCECGGSIWGVQALAHQCDYWGMLCLNKDCFHRL